MPTAAPPSPRRRGRSRGQGLAEFALVLPILLLLLLGALDLGRLFMSYITLTNVTRVAANYAAINPSAFTGTPMTGPYAAMVSRESAGLNCALRPDANGNLPPLPTFPAGTGLGAMSVATMTCDFTLLTPLINGVLGGPVSITASSEFPIRTGAISNIGGSTTLPPPGAPLADFDFTGVSGGSVDSSGNVTGVAPVTVNVIDSSVNAQAWEWDWGDGSPVEYGPPPHDHTYSSPGTFTVTLEVSNTTTSSTKTRSVTVALPPSPLPVAFFYGTPLPALGRYVDGGGSGGGPVRGSLPLVVDFTNESTDGTAFEWDFGDGTSVSTAKNPRHTYFGLGFYTVTLSVTAPPGGTSITKTDYIVAGCQVPNFANTQTSDAAASWSAADFSGTITYQPVGANGNSGASTTPPVPSKNIASQTLNGGDFLVPTRQNKLSPWVCAYDIKLRYQP